MDRHLSLSFELIYLMGWLLKHEKGMLNSLIKHALKNGLAQDLEKIQTDPHGDASQELQAIILEFLSFLERSLAKNLDIQQDSPLNGDNQELKMSIQRARELLSKKLSSSQENGHDGAEVKEKKASKKQAFNQALRGWKPSKADLIN